MEKSSRCPKPRCGGVVLKTQGRCKICGSLLHPKEVSAQVLRHFGTEMFLTSLHRLGPQTRMQLMRRGLLQNQIDHLVRCGILVRELDLATNLYYLKVDDAHIRL